MKRHLVGLAASAALLATATTASAGLAFNITYTAAVQANSNFAQIQTDVNFVANEFSSTYSDNVTVNFTIDQAPGGLGSSLFSSAYFRGSYGQVRAALAADAKSVDDASSVASLPAGAPAGSSSAANGWVLTSAQAKAVGLLAANNAASDGAYTFTSDPILNFDINNRAQAGLYDFISVTEHEFSELMGRTTQLSNIGFGNLGFDLFRFDAPGVRTFVAAGDCSAYFSVNNGVSNLKNYNCVAPGAADIQDWASGDPTDSYNAFGSAGVQGGISAVDVRVLDVIGWDLASANIPEPGTLVLVGLASGLMLLRRRQVAV